jgi:hypothetical protein
VNVAILLYRQSFINTKINWITYLIFLQEKAATPPQYRKVQRSLGAEVGGFAESMWSRESAERQ